MGMFWRIQSFQRQGENLQKFKRILKVWKPIIPIQKVKNPMKIFKNSKGYYEDFEKCETYLSLLELISIHSCIS